MAPCESHTYAELASELTESQDRELLLQEHCLHRSTMVVPDIRRMEFELVRVLLFSLFCQATNIILQRF